MYDGFNGTCCILCLSIMKIKYKMRIENKWMNVNNLTAFFKLSDDERWF